MTNQTIETLKDLGFNPVPARATFPTGDTFDLPVSIVPLGNTRIFLCHTEDAFNLLANHGAILRSREVKDINGVKYMSVPTARVESIFTSIARMRLLHSGDKEKVKHHQKLAPVLARNWINALPEETDHYIRSVAADSVADILWLD